MLDNEGKDNIRTIENTAKQIWGNMCHFGDIKVLEAPFCMFEMQMRIYDKFDILLTYDRSILGINIKVLGEFKNIRKFTSDEIKRGFESCVPENILYNFKVLDNILKAM